MKHQTDPFISVQVVAYCKAQNNQFQQATLSLNDYDDCRKITLFFDVSVAKG
jgi:hypothetical protein